MDAPGRSDSSAPSEGVERDPAGHQHAAIKQRDDLTVRARGVQIPARRPSLNRRPTVRRREIQAAMRSPRVVPSRAQSPRLGERVDCGRASDRHRGPYSSALAFGRSAQLLRSRGVIFGSAERWDITGTRSSVRVPGLVNTLHECRRIRPGSERSFQYVQPSNNFACRRERLLARLESCRTAKSDAHWAWHRSWPW